MQQGRPVKPIISDPLIIPRVKQYLEEHVHQTYVDVGIMARHLQEKYREYGRRKQQPFRFLVDQAYKTVLRSYGLDSNPSTEEEENSDVELMEDPPVQRNHMNNMLTDMYRTNVNESREPTAQNDGPIDISSDESDGDGTIPRSGNNGHLPLDFSKVPKDIVLSSIAKGTSVAEQLAGIQEESIKSKKVLAMTAPSVSISPVSGTKKRRLEGISFDSGSDRNASRQLPNRQPIKKFKKEFTAKKSEHTFESMGGIRDVIKQLSELLLHMNNPRFYRSIGLPPPRGILLHGPPGTGKTLLAQCIAGQLKVNIMQVGATELITGVTGESEERIRELVEQAALASPCILFLDEIETISANRNNASKDMERRIVSQLMISLDNLAKLPGGDRVLVIGATSRVETLDPSLRRVGRFDHEICLGIPDRDARSQILQVICKNLRTASFVDYDLIASLTPGFVGADLLALATRAAMLAMKKFMSEKQEFALNEESKKVNRSIERTKEFSLGDASLMQLDSDHKDEESTTSSPNNVEPMDIGGEIKDKDKDENQETQNSNNDVPEKCTTSDTNPTETKTSSPTNENVTDTKSDTSNTKNSPDLSNPLKPVTNTTPKSDSDLSLNISPQTLGEALLINSSIKDGMGMHVLFEWLDDHDTLVTDGEMNDLYITLEHFKEAAKLVQPAAKREGFITVPDVTWDDIGSLRDIREELNLAILAPVKYPNRLKTLGIIAPSGVLLFGPPGCGKTLLAKAIANEAGINFISVKGPELLNMYVGESERAVRQCFQRARSSAPCVIFFDEFDALCPKRSNTGDNQAQSRVVNQLLTEMDGVEDRKGVFIMAASNRPDIIDPAVMRPGRLDKILYVGFPEQQDRLEILQALTKQGKQPVLADDVNLEEIATITDAFTGADLAGLVRQASVQALRESLRLDETNENNIDLNVKKRHFTEALLKLRPSVSPQERVQYEILRQTYITGDKE